MKFEVKNEEKKENVLKFYLSQDDGDIDLYAETNSESFRVLTISESGRLKRALYLPDNVGLQINENRKIELGN